MKTCSKCNVELTNLNWWLSWQKQRTNICISCGRTANKIYDTKENAKNRKLKLLFNITLDEYNDLLKNQNNKCAICKSTNPSGKGNFHVDHCHKTGKIRGLLCHHCNLGLGNFKDDTELLNIAIEYLNKQNQ